MNNIYKTPMADLGSQNALSTSLYKTSGIGVATFLGSILAGGFLMYINFKRLGLEEKARKCLLYTFCSAVLVFGVIFAIPDDLNIPNMAFTIPQLIVMLQIAKNQQGSLIDNHSAAGGALSSNWKAFGIGILFSVALVLVVVAVVFSIALT